MLNILKKFFDFCTAEDRISSGANIAAAYQVAISSFNSLPVKTFLVVNVQKRKRPLRFLLTASLII